ncbi:MAG: N-acetyltransferase GCN5 [Chloroflexi bacterium OLB13]|nr:MAG: N-acetyltransferase GCN5 [Chloroflexi bacterium OLB13]
MNDNTAGIRAYEKVGFRLEGTIRQAVWREGKRWDILNYGFLRDEWLAKRR